MCVLQGWGWSPESWPKEGIVGWSWLNAKVRLSVGVEREAGTAHKLICHNEYVAAVLHYQCMSSPTATVDSLVQNA